MKFVTTTQLVARDQVVPDIMFLIFLPFLAVWEALKSAASIPPASQARGR
jgi:hypothetical protein